MEDPAADDTLRRHQALMQALSGEQAMSWTVWATFAYDSKCLTPLGRETALWAVDQLRRALGPGYIDHAFKQGVGLIGQGYWPWANDVPWVFANFFELACQFYLLQKVSKKVRASLQSNLAPDNWAHGLMQLELGGMGKRAGWDVAFEPELGTGNKADVRFSRDDDVLWFETTSMRESDIVQAIQARESQMGFTLSAMTTSHGVDIVGSFRDVLDEQAVATALHAIEEAAQATASDGRVRHIGTPGDGLLHIARNSTGVGLLTLEGPITTSDTWSRLITRIVDKAAQADGGTSPVWLRLDEYTYMFLFSVLRSMSLTERLNFLGSSLYEALKPYPSLAGIILAPTLRWAGSAEPESIRERIMHEWGAVALRTPLPGHRARETYIVARNASSISTTEVIADWYADEQSWLDWALQESGQPPFGALVHEPDSPK